MRALACMLFRRLLAPSCAGRPNRVPSAPQSLSTPSLPAPPRSTFTPTRYLRTVNCIGPGLMAECMSAACYRKPAWDGSPITCYCPMVQVPEGQSYGLGRRNSTAEFPCAQPDGYTISGEYTAVSE